MRAVTLHNPPRAARNRDPVYAELSDDDELYGSSPPASPRRTLRSRTTARASPKTGAPSSRTKSRASATPYARPLAKAARSLASPDISPPMFVDSYAAWRARAMAKGKGIKGNKFYSKERREELLAAVEFASKGKRGYIKWRCPCGAPPPLRPRKPDVTRHINNCHSPAQPCIGVLAADRYQYPELGPDAGSVLWTNEYGVVEVRVGGCGTEVCDRKDAKKRHINKRGGLCVWPSEVSIPNKRRSGTRL